MLRLGLVSGQFELTVDPIRDGQRFVADLPDGELEVHGTRFVVNTDEARTVGIRVLEGLVSVRLRGRAPLFLGAGASWEATLAPAVEPPVESKVGPQAAPAPVRKVAASKRRLPERKEHRPASTEAGAGTSFARAMAAFSAGDYGHAEQLFTEFLSAHASDTRAEDVRFLVAVGRQRRGDVAGARAAAREYLRFYPGGLRRLEAERLASSPIPP
jgi:hypothetical protein